MCFVDAIFGNFFWTRFSVKLLFWPKTRKQKLRRGAPPKIFYILFYTLSFLSIPKPGLGSTQHGPGGVRSANGPVGPLAKSLRILQSAPEPGSLHRPRRGPHHLKEHAREHFTSGIFSFRLTLYEKKQSKPEKHFPSGIFSFFNFLLCILFRWMLQQKIFGGADGMCDKMGTRGDDVGGGALLKSL